MPLIQISAPAVEPVSVAEVLDSFRSDDDAYHSQANIAIKALRCHAEARIGRALITQTMELVLDVFPSAGIDLILPCIQSIVSLKYIDMTGTQITLDPLAYSLNSSSIPCWLLPSYGYSWPDTLAVPNSVRVQFVVGYGDAAEDVPEEIRLWIIAHVAQLLGSPDGMSDKTLAPLVFIDRLLDSFIVYR